MLYRHFSSADTKLNCACGCGKGLKDMNKSFMCKLDTARRFANTPFIIISGYRCPSYNAKVSQTGRYGAHTTGHAIDVQVTTSRKRYLILKALIEVGFNRIGIGKGMIHVDDDPGKDQNVIWEY